MRSGGGVFGVRSPTFSKMSKLVSCRAEAPSQMECERPAFHIPTTCIELKSIELLVSNSSLSFIRDPWNKSTANTLYTIMEDLVRKHMGAGKDQKVFGMNRNLLRSSSSDVL